MEKSFLRRTSYEGAGKIKKVLYNNWLIAPLALRNSGGVRDGYADSGSEYNNYNKTVFAWKDGNKHLAVFDLLNSFPT